MTHGTPLRSQRGVGLIEVLVAVLILSIGFLGVGALIARSMSTNNSASARSMATIESYSIMDAMRADLAQAKANAYNTASPLKATACPAAGTTLASSQLNLWCKQLGQNLGVADTTTGKVQCDASGTCTITITYDDSHSTSATAAAQTTQTVVTKGML